MKTILGIAFFIIGGFISAFIIGFDFNRESATIHYDDEQLGIKNQIVIQFSHVVAENTPKGLAAQRFAELVRKKTNNQVKVEVFPNGILYSDKEELNALIEGRVQMIAPATSKLTSQFPKWQALDLPFAFPTDEAIEEALKGEIGQSLFSTLEKENIKGMSFWNNGFKQVSNNINPLIHPSDFKDKSFRIMPSSVIASQFETLGATTRTIPFNQTYRNLENGMIDGQENTLSNIHSKKFYQVQEYMTISNHGYLGYAVLMNREFWDSLHNDVQEAITEAMDETTRWIQSHAQKINEQKLKQIQQYPDIEIHILTDEQKQEWIRQFEPVYKEYELIVGKQLIEDIRKIRDKYSE